MSDMHNDNFDRAARAAHARAVQAVPPALLYGLQVRTANAHGAPRARPQRGGWWLAGGLAAALALAVGLQLPDPAPPPASDAPLPSLATASDVAEAGAWDEGLAALDEDPDLYLWLASQDSLVLAME